MCRCRGWPVKVANFAFLVGIVRGAHRAVEGAGHEAWRRFFAFAHREVVRAHCDHPGACNPMYLRKCEPDEVRARAVVGLGEVPRDFLLSARRWSLARVPASSTKTRNALLCGNRIRV